MNSTLGLLGIVLALSASIAAAVMLAVGLVTGRTHLRVMAARYAWVVLGGAALAAFALERALITRDFTVRYVFDTGSSQTPPLYNFATWWSALEGSLLLWALILAGYLAIVVFKFRKRVADPLVGWALLTMFLVAAFFFALLIGPTNPFGRVDPPVGYDGPGPDPLLQNHWLMAFHPPMLYLGFVGFTVPFAFAIAALATGRLGEGWLLETRRWTLFAWGFLTAGILLGAWWAYDVLGWGGYWGWDPVENASFLPWLTGTAYLHSVLVQERRGMLRVWNLALVCATFSLTILATFITRSGIIGSVHAFSDGSIGTWLLAFFAVVVGVTVGLIYWRGDRLRSPGRIDSPLSREGALLANNLAFAAFAFIVLLGTVAPLLVEALQNRRISVGAPYYERMSLPVGFAILFLMALAPVLPWRKADEEVLRDRLEWPAWFGTAAVVTGVILGARGIMEFVAYGLAGFAGGSAIRQLAVATRRQGVGGLVGRANGGMIVHIGVIVVAVAIAASGGNIRQAEFELEEGQSVLGDHKITYEGAEDLTFSNRQETRVHLDVDGQALTPALQRFVASGRVIRTPSTTSSLGENLQVSLIVVPEAAGDTVVVRATAQPLISWLWIGGLIMLGGTVLSAFPTRRHRRPTEPASAPLPAVVRS